MRDLAALTEQIRAVRGAQRRFMSRWRLEQVLVGPELLDRLAEDMAAAHLELDEPEAGPGDAGFVYRPPRRWSMYTNGGADGAS